jgi:mycothiol synthase
VHARMNGDMGFIDELSVRRPWRRLGVGMALLRAIFAAFYRRGVTTVGLGVDAANLTGATRLYERAGMRVYSEWDVYEKTLRPAPTTIPVQRATDAEGERT